MAIVYELLGQPTYIRLFLIHWKLFQAGANVIFCAYRWFYLNFLEQLPLVEQYHAVSISSTWLDPEREIGQQLVYHDLVYYEVYYETTHQQVHVVMSSILPTIRSYFPWHLSCVCVDSMDTYTYNHCELYILIVCNTMWILTHAFFAELFSQWMQLWHFKLVWMIAHEWFEGKLHLQLTWKVEKCD